MELFLNRRKDTPISHENPGCFKDGFWSLSHTVFGKKCR
jgi:hypothetical protein